MEILRILKKAVCVSLAVLLFCACQEQPQQEIFNILSGKDRNPPVLLGTGSIASDTLVCYFNEPVTTLIGEASIEEGLNILSVESTAHEARFILDAPVLPGTYATITARVKDQLGNSLRYRATCWGKNEHLPHMLINEFTTKGSTNHPDRVELLALSAGDLGGITFYEGIGSSYDCAFMLPSQPIDQGDLIVLYFGQEPEGVSPSMFFASETGLGGNNGVLTLCACPEGEILDAVLYSDRTSTSDTTFGGFGTRKIQERVALLDKGHSWTDPDSQVLRPESAVDSSTSTATRSFCRSPEPHDTDTRADWHIVPTGKASFGKMNTSEVYGR